MTCSTLGGLRHLQCGFSLSRPLTSQLGNREAMAGGLRMTPARAMHLILGLVSCPLEHACLPGSEQQESFCGRSRVSRLERPVLGSDFIQRQWLSKSGEGSPTAFQLGTRGQLGKNGRLPATGPCWVFTTLLGPSPHHGLVRVLQQEAHRHERDALLLVHKDRHPATVTLVHGLALCPEHAWNAGATQVHIQDPHLQGG